jgi:hypothetical protein
VDFVMIMRPRLLLFVCYVPWAIEHSRHRDCHNRS